MALYPTSRDVPIAEYLYRHEAEFAAGFLEDAGIPFRLQVDDAGGADAGVTISRPARLWVRAEDVEEALEVLEIQTNADLSPEPGEEAEASAPFIPRPRDTNLSVGPQVVRRTPPAGDPSGTALRGAERIVAGTLSVVFLGLGLGITPLILAPGFTVLGIVLAVVFGIGAVFGRSVGPFRTALRVLSGHLR